MSTGALGRQTQNGWVVLPAQPGPRQKGGYLGFGTSRQRAFS